MSDRVIVFRVAGVGGDYDQTAFVSRRLSYPAKQLVCVKGMGAAYSSELRPFNTKGSAPTTQIMLLWSQAMAANLLSAVYSPIATASGDPVVTVGYVGYQRPTVVDVNDATNIAVGDVVSLALEAVKVTAKGVSPYGFDRLTVESVRGSRPVAHPYTSDGALPGVTLYSAIPGITGLTCTISVVSETAVSADEEEIIFRGVIGEISHDTSAGGENIVSISLNAMISALDATPWQPRQFKLTRGGITCGDQQFGNPWFMTAQTPTWLSAQASQAGGNNVDGEPQIPCPFVAAIVGDSWAVYAVDETGISETGFAVSLHNVPVSAGRDRAFVTALRPGVDIRRSTFNTAIAADFAALYNRETGETNEAAIVWQEFVVAKTVRGLLWRILTGEIDYTPVGTGNEVSFGTTVGLDPDAVDWPSFDVVGDLLALQVVTFSNPYDGNATWYALPPLTSGDSSLFEWLEKCLLKPALLGLVYDAGKLRCVSWAQVEQWPVALSASNLATPAAKLVTSKGSVIQCVSIKGLGIGALTGSRAGISEPELRYINRSAATESGGQLVAIETPAVQAGSVVDPVSGATFNVFEPVATVKQAALVLIERYGRPTPILGVSCRDSSVVYRVGQQVVVTLPTVQGPTGAMGLIACRAVVISATRDWMSKVSAYQLILYGYNTAVGRMPVWGASACVKSWDDGTRTATIEEAWYTYGPTSPPGDAPWPQTDAQAFAQTALLAPYPTCILLDQYGTPYTVTTPPALNAATDGTGEGLLEFVTAFDPATPAAGDVIVFAGAPYQPDPTAWLDAFWSDASGNVLGPDGDFAGWGYLP